MHRTESVVLCPLRIPVVSAPLLEIGQTGSKVLNHRVVLQGFRVSEFGLWGIKACGMESLYRGSEFRACGLNETATVGHGASTGIRCSSCTPENVF